MEEGVLLNGTTLFLYISRFNIAKNKKTLKIFWFLNYSL